MLDSGLGALEALGTLRRWRNPNPLRGLWRRCEVCEYVEAGNFIGCVERASECRRWAKAWEQRMQFGIFPKGGLDSFGHSLVTLSDWGWKIQ
jgi:hypothetical protein